MQTSKCIYARRSIRRFTDKPVDRALLTELCRLAAAAPSAANRCPWAFLAVDDADKLAALKEALPYFRNPAPAAIIVLGDKSRFIPRAQEYWVQDCSAAMENILLGAVEMGLGATWLGVYPVQARVDALRSCLGIPEQLIPLGVASLGWPAEEAEPRTQLNEASQLFFNSFDGFTPTEYSLPALQPSVGDIIRTRRSVRQYVQGVEIPDDIIRQLLDAGFCAPTARNLRPWEFYVTRDPKKLSGVLEFHPFATALPQAGCAILVCAGSDRQPDHGYMALDCAAATQNILLQAHALGYGALWMGIYPRPERMEGARRVFELPEGIEPITLIAVGAPQNNDAPERPRYDEAHVHFESWD